MTAILIHDVIVGFRVHMLSCLTAGGEGGRQVKLSHGGCLRAVRALR